MRLLGSCGVIVGLVGCYSPGPLHPGSGSIGDESSDDGGSEDGDESSTGEDADDAKGPAMVDVLFVIDDSATMGPAQGAVASAAATLAEQLVDAGVDLHVATTTTDYGHPWCSTTTPSAGRLALSSCREHLDEFTSILYPDDDLSTRACTSVCDLDTIPVANARPWIEAGPAGTNLAGVAVGDALGCALPAGITGCGFEQPLESMARALELAADPAAPEHGFLRDEAHLVVVIVSDETDCSFADERIFNRPESGGTTQYWEDPELTAPTSAICWNAGVECTGGPGVYEDCRASDRGLAGEVDVAPDDAVLQPASRYANALAQLHDAKQAASGASVMLFGIVGVPSEFPDVGVTFADAVDPSEQIDWGIGPSCIGAGTKAIPPVRVLAVGDELDGPTGMYSICADDQTPAMQGIADAVLAHVAD